MFTEVPPLNRPSAAAEAGFAGVEIFVFDPEEVADLKRELQRNKLELVQLYAHCGAFDAGERGVAIFPGREIEFRRSIEEAVDAAVELSCPRVNCLTGILTDSVTRDLAEEALLSNLAWAAARCGEAGLKLLIEPISNQGPNYFVRLTSEARTIIDRIGDPNLRLMLDLYHTQVLEGNLTETLESHLDVIDHIQIADVPGRHEPGTGEINYEFLLSRLDALGYDGWIGCEYRPLSDTKAGLEWAARYLRPPATSQAT